MISAATQIEILSIRLKKLGYNNLDKKQQDLELLDLVQCVKDHINTYVEVCFIIFMKIIMIKSLFVDLCQI